jgi:hypothetical protein
MEKERDTLETCVHTLVAWRMRESNSDVTDDELRSFIDTILRQYIKQTLSKCCNVRYHETLAKAIIIRESIDEYKKSNSEYHLFYIVRNIVKTYLAIIFSARKVRVSDEPKFIECMEIFGYDSRVVAIRTNRNNRIIILSILSVTFITICHWCRNKQ